MFMFHGQAINFPATTRTRGKTEFASSKHPSEGPHSPSVPQWLNSPKPGSLLVGVKKSQLSSTRRVTVLRRLTGKKKSNSMCQNCRACCYGNEPCPHLHLFLNVLSGLSLPLCGRRFFFLFHIFPRSSHIMGDGPRHPLCF